jgi:hypothetical protein
MSQAIEIYTIISALKEAEKVMNLRKDWKSKNDEQDNFLKNFLEACRNDNVNQIELKVSDKAEIINSFLEKKGFSIRLQPFPLYTFGFASILDLLVEWVNIGKKVKIEGKNGVKFDGVRIDKDGVIFYKSDLFNDLAIAAVQTKSGDIVYLTVIKEPIKGIDLINIADDISKDMNVLLGRYDGVRFPMVNLDIINDIDWLKGLSTTKETNNIPAEITQAIQQIKIKMNEKGARFKSGTAMAVTLSAVRIDIRQDLIIKEPFLLWVERKGLKKPLMAAFITEEDWKDPENLN